MPPFTDRSPTDSQVCLFATTRQTQRQRMVMGLPRNAISLAAFLSLVMLSGCRPVPQVAHDEVVFGELDALYTAVTARKPGLLAECKARLEKLHQESRLSDAGFQALAGVFDKCEDEEWMAAAEELYAFMRAQRKQD